MSVEKTLNERASTHGDFNTGAVISQDLCATLRTGPSWNKLSDAQKEALEMIAHKMARIVNGNPDFADHYLDIGGYAHLAEVTCSDYKGNPNAK
jgi:hypothetical protein